MTGNKGRLRATLGLPQAPQGHGGRQNGRLGLVGLVELFGRAVLGQRPEVIAESGRGFGKRLADRAVLCAQLGEHADRLGALAGKNESEGRRHGANPLCTCSSRGLRRRRPRNGLTVG
ncbi:hypothetical protein D3C86_1721120 [compost metagenome]